MRYPKDHKEKAKLHMLDASGGYAKQNGFFSSGVDSLAAAAGVTSGALYKHFDGKAGLFAAVVDTELRKSLERFANVSPDNTEEASKALASYLSMAHVRHPAEGCVLPAMTAEVARSDDSTRQRFQAGLEELKDLMKQWTPGDDEAWTLLAQCVGAVMLARAMADEKRQKEVLSAVRRQTLKLLES